MLNRLIDLKKRREKRLRQRMSEGNKHSEELLIKEGKLKESLTEFRKTWQETVDNSTGVMTFAEYEDVSRKLKFFLEQDRIILEKIKASVYERQRWESEKLTLQNDINRCCAQQEKLKFVIEDLDNDH